MGTVERVKALLGRFFLGVLLFLLVCADSGFLVSLRVRVLDISAVVLWLFGLSEKREKRRLARRMLEKRVEQRDGYKRQDFERE
jgi:hypothetical protein